MSPPRLEPGQGWPLACLPTHAGKCTSDWLISRIGRSSRSSSTSLEDLIGPVCASSVPGPQSAGMVTTPAGALMERWSPSFCRRTSVQVFGVWPWGSTDNSKLPSSPTGKMSGFAWAVRVRTIPLGMGALKPAWRASNASSQGAFQANKTRNGAIPRRASRPPRAGLPFLRAVDQSPCRASWALCSVMARTNASWAGRAVPRA